VAIPGHLFRTGERAGRRVVAGTRPRHPRTTPGRSARVPGPGSPARFGVMGPGPPQRRPQSPPVTSTISGPVTARPAPEDLPDRLFHLLFVDCHQDLFPCPDGVRSGLTIVRMLHRTSRPPVGGNRAPSRCSRAGACRARDGTPRLDAADGIADPGRDGGAGSLVTVSPCAGAPPSPSRRSARSITHQFCAIRADRARCHGACRPPPVPSERSAGSGSPPRPVVVGPGQRQRGHASGRRSGAPASVSVGRHFPSSGPPARTCEVAMPFASRNGTCFHRGCVHVSRRGGTRYRRQRPPSPSGRGPAPSDPCGGAGAEPIDRRPRRRCGPRRRPPSQRRATAELQRDRGPW